MPETFRNELMKLICGYRLDRQSHVAADLLADYLINALLSLVATMNPEPTEEPVMDLPPCAEVFVSSLLDRPPLISDTDAEKVYQKTKDLMAEFVARGVYCDSCHIIFHPSQQDILQHSVERNFQFVCDGCKQTQRNSHDI